MIRGKEIAAVDPDAQAFVRDTTRPFVVEMVMALVTIARDPKTGARDRMKAAVRVIDYHLTAGRENADDSGQPRFGVVIVNESTVTCNASGLVRNETRFAGSKIA